MTLEEIGLKLTAVATDVKWLKDEAIIRNGKFDKHLGESDKFRHQVTRNTAWRWAYKLTFMGVFAVLIYIMKYIFK